MSSIKKVVFVGLSGSGKTGLAQEFARFSGRPFLDSDREIERKASKSVDEIFRVEGENHFRELEAKVVEEVLAANEKVVVSLGGGAFSLPEVRGLVSKSAAKVVWLEASLAELYKRLTEVAQTEQRPLLTEALKDFESFSSFYEEKFSPRLEYFKKEASCRVDTSFLFEDNADSSAAVLREDLFILLEYFLSREADFRNAKGGVFFTGSVVGGRPSVIVKSDCLVGRIGSIVEKLSSKEKSKGKCVFVTDSNVKTHWLAELDGGFKAKSVLTEFEAGEESKRLEVFEKLAEKLVVEDVTRTDSVVALGGGVVGDIAGFLASTYMRGVEFYQIPTSVVAQVDSAVGGKTGVDLKGGKNLVGSLYAARVVFIDPAVLRTLPEREYLSGLAEVVKYGAIASEEFFSWLEQNAQRILERETSALLEMVRQCVVIKQQHVFSDPRDVKGLRARLNFGHTVGHALEKIWNYSHLLHGEAVSIGMIAAARFASELGLLEEVAVLRLKALLEEFSLPVEIQTPKSFQGKSLSEQREVWEAALRADKKRTGNDCAFIFIEKLGTCMGELQQVPYSRVVEFLLNLRA